MRLAKKITTLILSGIIATGLIPAMSISAGTASITIDGVANDWDNIEEIKGNKDYVSSWKVASDDNNLYLMYTGIATGEWDFNYTGIDYCFEVKAENGTNHKFYVSYDWNGHFNVKNADSSDRPGTSAACVNGAFHNTAGNYVVELSVPKGEFGSNFTFAFDGTSIASKNIPDANTPAKKSGKSGAVYNGIVVDGKFDDWDAVSRVNVKCPCADHPDCIASEAVIWDGDYLYIYFEEADGIGVYNSGSHKNGRFTIKSDLGRETEIQVKDDGTVSGVNGAKAVHFGNEWEIAVPNDQLPNYNESLNFCFYEGPTIVADIMNIQDGYGKKPFNGEIVYDGQYDDWKDYPHHTIEYFTAGNNEPHIDAKGALYQSDDKLIGHVVTNLFENVAEGGGEFNHGVTVTFNTTNPEQDAWKQGAYTFYWRVVTVDANGNINWHPQDVNLAPGTYEFSLASTYGLPYGVNDDYAAWGQATNINTANSHDQIYGKMIMTLDKDGKDEMEFYLDTVKLAKCFGCDASDLRVAAAKFERIGDEWIFAAGTSSGPIIGVCISAGAVVLVLGFRRKIFGNKFAGEGVK